MDSDPSFVAKHNALHNYLKANTTPAKKLIGGVIVPKGSIDNRTWKYADNLIDRANDTTGWVSFEPSLVNA
ncbi:MAG: hypothetical protein R2852_00015 [Bacteroidia bacterium]